MYRNGNARRTTASAGRQKVEITTPAPTSPQPTSQKMTVRVVRIHAGYTGCSDDRRAATSCYSTWCVTATLPEGVLMKMRTFWLDLGWLVVLVVTFAVPLTLDAFGRLNYFTSLTIWLIPILYLWPTFGMLTANGTGRRRKALRWTVASIVGLGVV